jgi:hypothetical protein
MRVLLRDFLCSKFGLKVYLSIIALGSFDQFNVFTIIVLVQDSNWMPFFGLSKHQFAHVCYHSALDFKEFALLQSQCFIHQNMTVWLADCHLKFLRSLDLGQVMAHSSIEYMVTFSPKVSFGILHCFSFRLRIPCK